MCLHTRKHYTIGGFPQSDSIIICLSLVFVATMAHTAQTTSPLLQWTEAQRR